MVVIVSMNMFIFYPNLFDMLEKDFNKFLKNAATDLLKDEFLIPNVVFERIKSEDITCEVIDNHAIWKGITYKEDLEELKEYINNEIEREVYPKDLY